MELRELIEKVMVKKGVISDEEHAFLIRAGYSVHENKIYKIRREFNILNDGTVE